MSNAVLEKFARELCAIREGHKSSLPQTRSVRDLCDLLLKVLFPHFDPERSASFSEIEVELLVINENLKRILHPLEKSLAKPVEEVCKAFMEALPGIHSALVADADAIYKGDPAASSVDEVILAYPGFFAIATFRIAHQFYELGVPYLPRILTEYAHQLTGVDIHPGATIGRSFFIDHGTGIVIGETTIIKDNVKIYQGVTLGALSVEKSLANKKRHPTIEENVVIYSNATILGGETVIGRDSIVGGNVWLTASVPPSSMVYHQSEVKVKQSKNQ